MIINDWNVWHTYASSILGKRPELAQWAKAAVDLDLASISVHQDGRCWYRVRDSVRSASTQIEFAPNRAEGTFAVPSDASDFAKECLLQAAAMRTHEQYVLADSLGRMPAYIRIFFEPSVLEFSSFAVRVYPQAKLYDDGTLLLEFRVLSPDTGYDSVEFVDEQVNLFSAQAIAAELPIGLVLAAATHNHCFGRRRAWAKLKPWRVALKGKFLRLSRTDQESEFPARRVRFEGDNWDTFASFELAPKNLRELANIHVWALMDAAALADRSQFEVIRTPGKRRLGNYWSARPSVYVGSTEPQPVHADELLSTHAEVIASILLRTSASLNGPPAELIGPNLRPFGDYAVFSNGSVILWVGLGSGSVRTESHGDPAIDQRANLGYFVYTKQVQVEFIEYWCIAHRIAEELASEPTGTMRALAQMERTLVMLDRIADEVPRAIEVTGLIRHVGASTNIAGIASQVRASLRFKEIVMQDNRDRKAAVFGATLAILLGLTGAPALSDALIQPLWIASGWSHPDCERTWGLLSLAITSVVLLVLAGTAAFAIHGTRRRA